MKWRKASDTNPEGKDRVKLPIKYKGSPDLLIFINGVWFWFEKNIEESRNFPVHEYSWSAIEWLDESSSLPVTGESEAIGFAEWATKEYTTVKFHGEFRWCTYEVSDFGSAKDSDYMTTAELYNLYKQSKK